MDCRSEIISIPVNVILVLDECIHKLAVLQKHEGCWRQLLPILIGIFLFINVLEKFNLTQIITP